jgi:hypothetical protein
MLANFEGRIFLNQRLAPLEGLLYWVRDRAISCFAVAVVVSRRRRVFLGVVTARVVGGAGRRM